MCPANLSQVIPGKIGTMCSKLQVRVERIIYSANGFTVMQVRQDLLPKGKGVFTAVGAIGEVREEERVIISGKWVDNAKFGMQLSLSGLEYPDLSGEAVYDFLIGGFVKGIGPKLGQEIWETFGTDTAWIFETSPHELKKVRGIGEAKLSGIVDSWREMAGKRKALVEFSKMGLHSGIIQKIFQKWPNPAYALELIHENPYLLAWEISGVGFQTADLAARYLRLPANSEVRLQASLGYALHEAAVKEGHCYLERSELLKRAMKLLDMSLPLESLEKALQMLVDEGKLSTWERHDDTYQVLISLRNIFKTENELASRVYALSKGQFPRVKNFDALIDSYQQRFGIQLHAGQKEAIRIACENQVSVITGGPGTGKTTIIKALVWIFRQFVKGIDIGLCAPTGRAAKRMSESTGYEASTIHRFLAYHPKQGFVHDSSNPLPYDVVICDESSMLDIYLANSLVRALRKGSRIVLVGDVNQLPSVGAGAVLKDCICSKLIPVARLTEIYRQSDHSFIAYNAKAILEGKFQSLNLSNKTDDFFWMGIVNQKLPVNVRQEMIRKAVTSCIKRLLELGLNVHEVQVLCPMYTGEIGVNALNLLLQKIINPQGRVIFQGKERQLCLGDKVMQLRNNYDKEVFNGDQGIIVGGYDDLLTVNFDGKDVDYKKDELNEITLSYAMTIHKAQGSEAKAVVQVLSTSHHIMLNRAILYTGITRARERCILIGEMAAVRQAVQNNKPLTRYTLLNMLLRDLDGKNRRAA